LLHLASLIDTWVAIRRLKSRGGCSVWALLARFICRERAIVRTTPPLLMVSYCRVPPLFFLLFYRNDTFSLLPSPGLIFIP